MSKIRPYLLVISLLILEAVLYSFQYYFNIPNYHNMALQMVVITNVFYVIGWLFFFIKKYMWALRMGHVDFVLICISLCYSTTVIDIIIFFAMLAVLLDAAIHLQPFIQPEWEKDL